MAEGAQLGGEGADLMGLDGQEHDVVGTGLAGRRHRGTASHDHSAILEDDGHSAGPDCLEVGAPGDEGDLLAGGGEGAAEVAADRPGADDRDRHL